jgi:hypothetical protein
MEEELGWFRQLARKAREAYAGKVQTDLSGALADRSTSGDAAKAPWRSFDLVDDMENGLCREMITSFITPPSLDRPGMRLIVERSPDRSEYILRSKDSEPLLFARGSKNGRQIDMYIPIGGDPPLALGPAFTLAASNADRTAWVLSSRRCECCAYLPEAKTCTSCSNEYRRDLAFIRTSLEEVHDTHINCMEVEIPALCADGNPTTWCRRTGGYHSDLAKKRKLVSRRPKWSEEVDGLQLDFRGRVTRASPKNIQLDADWVQKSSNQKPELLHGKIGDDTFVLDYHFPLGMAQAFAIALTTQWWP